MTTIERRGNHDLTVAKFGGTSGADGPRLARAHEIVESDPRRRWVVLSAPGARVKGDGRVTQFLRTCHKLVSEGASFEDAFRMISERFHTIGDFYQLTTVGDYLDNMETSISGGDRAKTEVQGELVQANIAADAFSWNFIDPQKIIKLRDDGMISEMSYRLLAHHTSNDTVNVIPGYYGSHETTGTVMILPPGGSDITAAVVARQVKELFPSADVLYENWTDVDGFSAGDPRVVGEHRHVPEITYQEMRELAYRGAQVFHGDAVIPLYRQKIPVNLRNSNNPNHPGTMIVPTRTPPTGEIVVGIAGKKGFTGYAIEKVGINQQVGVLGDMLEVFHRHGVSIDHAPTGLDAVTILVDREHLKPRMEGEILTEIQRLVDPDTITASDHLGLVTVVGVNMRTRSHEAFAAIGRLFGANGIGIEVGIYPRNGLSVTVGVKGDQVNDAVKLLYAELIR